MAAIYSAVAMPDGSLPPVTTEEKKKARPPPRRYHSAKSQNIHPSEAKHVTTPDLVTATSWEAMGLSAAVLRVANRSGFDKPTLIQQQSMIALKMGQNCQLQAPSGTGKTTGVLLNVLQRVRVDLLQPQAIILSPTHELAVQSAERLRQLAGDDVKIRVLTAIGGGDSKLRDNETELRHGIHVVCGTPGRIKNLIRGQGTSILSPSRISLIIFDEADTLLKDRFLDDSTEILNRIKQTRRPLQQVMISATMDETTMDAAGVLMKNDACEVPVKVVQRREDTLQTRTVSHFFSLCEDVNQKNICLANILASPAMPIKKAIVFANSSASVAHIAKRLSDILDTNRVTILAVSGKDDQRTRQKVHQDFIDAKGGCVVVATDCYQRGIDISDVRLVINFELPADQAGYVHRTGRCGRYDQQGCAISLVDRRELPGLKRFENRFSCDIIELQLDIMNAGGKVNAGDSAAPVRKRRGPPVESKGDADRPIFDRPSLKKLKENFDHRKSNEALAAAREKRPGIVVTAKEREKQREKQKEQDMVEESEAPRPTPAPASSSSSSSSSSTSAADDYDDSYDENTEDLVVKK